MNNRSADTVGGGIHGDDIFARIISPENLFDAWREFRRGKRGKRDVQEFEFALEDNIFQLHDELNRSVYSHGPYTPFSVNDPKPRRIHKASVRDRLVHHALFRVLYPLFDRGFINDSYSCRVGKGAHRAVKRLQQFARRASDNNRKSIWALKCDIRRFFDSINHGILFRLIQRKIPDGRALGLIRCILVSFEKSPGVGLPLGNVTSQLFANTYLNELDRFVKHRLGIRPYIRYCDDFVILLGDSEYASELVGELHDVLRYSLQLQLHPNKIELRTWRQGIDFLGYVTRPYCTTIRTKTKRRMLQQATVKNVMSYLGMLKHCDGFEIRFAFLHHVNAWVASRGRTRGR